MIRHVLAPLGFYLVGGVVVGLVVVGLVALLAAITVHVLGG